MSTARKLYPERDPTALLWERDFDKSEREFLEALELNPQYMQARCWYGLFFLQWGVGRIDEGLREAWRAFESDPLSGYATMVLSFALATADRFEEAVAHARTAVQYDPGRRDVNARSITDLGDDLLRGETSGLPLQAEREQSRMDRRPAELRQHDVGMALGDWVLPFVYNQTIAGFDHSAYTWLMLGAFCGLVAQHRFAAEGDG